MALSQQHLASLAVFLGLCAGSLPAHARAQALESATKPLVHLDDLRYEGAFRLPADTFGESSLNYSEGPLAYDAVDHSIYIVGHSHHQAIAEFLVPDLVQSPELEDLNMGAPVQFFSRVLHRASGGNPQSLDRIGGMMLVQGPNGPELLVNAYEYYDAPGDNTLTTLVVRDADDLAGAQVDGFFRFEGGAGHTSGWMSPIPADWHAPLGATHLTGQSSGLPIISRLSVGPSAFGFDPFDIVGNGSVPSPVPTVQLLDFSLNEPLHPDLSNVLARNSLWTHMSRAVYGFIVPGSRTYLTLGHSAGHASGVCYKCTQNDGTECGGYCPPDADDYYHYYWLWDVDDLVAVRNGQLSPWEARPYEYAELPLPFETRQLGGGSFDPSSGRLYVSVQRADTEQGTYANPPVVVAFALGQ